MTTDIKSKTCGAHFLQLCINKCLEDKNIKLVKNLTILPTCVLHH